MKNTKNCTQCKIDKPLNEFYTNKTKNSGFSSECKKCSLEYKKELYKNNKNLYKERTMIFFKKFPWMLVFTNIKQRCNNPNNPRYKDWGGRGIKCLITEEELKELWFRDKAYEMKQPSIDRINNDGDYCLENCRFIEFEINRIKDRGKKILQFDKQGVFIKEWDSIKDASEYLSICHSHISQVVRNIVPHAKGFYFKYK